MRAIAFKSAILVFVVFSYHAAIAATPPPQPSPTPAPAPPGMVLIPGGSFMMGCVEGDRWCTRREKPAHKVTIKPFYMDKAEVTVVEYGQCVIAGTCTKPGLQGNTSGTLLCNYGSSVRSTHPINCVNWDQARTYCQWSAKRLPSEAEWEYAARGGHSEWVYPWGNDEADCSMAVIAEKGDGCGRNSTWPVGSKPANAFGLFDMAGNVWEWVEDCYSDGYNGAPPDGTAWTREPCSLKCNRGGALYSLSHATRASNRGFSEANDDSDGIGFRCAKSVQ